MTDQFDPYQYNKVAIKLMYLVVLTNNKKNLYYLTTDKPDYQLSGITAKGFVIEEEKETVEQYQELIKNKSKELITEIFFPWHRVHEIKNILFKAK